MSRQSHSLASTRVRRALAPAASGGGNRGSAVAGAAFGSMEFQYR
jgi:hypothetical protein